MCCLEDFCEHDGGRDQNAPDKHCGPENFQSQQERKDGAEHAFTGQNDPGFAGPYHTLGPGLKEIADPGGEESQIEHRQKALTQRPDRQWFILKEDHQGTEAAGCEQLDHSDLDRRFLTAAQVKPHNVRGEKQGTCKYERFTGSESEPEIALQCQQQDPRHGHETEQKGRKRRSFPDDDPEQKRDHDHVRCRDQS